MNKGKVCVSVSADNAKELIALIRRAESLADVVEIRFDSLPVSEMDSFFNAFRKNDKGTKYLATFRASEQGGLNSLTQAERIRFWQNSRLFAFCDWADLEEDIPIDSLRGLSEREDSNLFIKSSHDFNGVPTDLFEIYERLAATNCDVIKLAVNVGDIKDCIPLWKLLERAKSENRKLIPVAMSESGKWTRIIGLANGAFLTYASLETGSETAPGQVSVDDLTNVYRAKELDSQTQIYGILGSNTSVSMSPYIHNTAFRFHRLNSVFVPLQVLDLDSFFDRMVKHLTREIALNFCGFSVTIPHKQDILRHLDVIDETAKAIGAVNTVKIVDGQLYGYNTDAAGFIEPLLDVYGDLNDANVAVLGSGGASRACIYALRSKGATVTVFARSVGAAESLAKEFGVSLMPFPGSEESLGAFDIVVNSTPLGMKGKTENETPVTAKQLLGVKLVYDLVYIPAETKLIKEAKKAGIPTIGGLEMLLAQAAEQQNIWTGRKIPEGQIRRIVTDRIC